MDTNSATLLPFCLISIILLVIGIVFADDKKNGFLNLPPKRPAKDFEVDVYPVEFGDINEKDAWIKNCRIYATYLPPILDEENRFQLIWVWVGDPVDADNERYEGRFLITGHSFNKDSKKPTEISVDTSICTPSMIIHIGWLDMLYSDKPSDYLANLKISSAPRYRSKPTGKIEKYER